MNGYGSHQDVQWEEPRFAHYLRRLATIGRLVTFDRRGAGASDRLEREPTLEERVQDIHGVLDAIGIERTNVFATTGSCQPAILFAATAPERVERLVLYAVQARVLQAPDYPWGLPQNVKTFLLDSLEAGAWGTGGTSGLFAPSLREDARFVEWQGRYERAMASPASARQILNVTWSHDVRDVLASIAVPTLVLSRVGHPEGLRAGARFVAERIPRAVLQELPGIDEYPFVGESDAVVDAVEEFVTGTRAAPASARVLTTVLFTDLVDSTARASELGDRRWRALLDSHDETVRGELRRFGGTEINTTGDGFLARFDGPARAVRCALAIRDAVAALGLEIRAGVHTGEVELRGDDVAGVAVHVAARVAAEAGPAEVLTTTTVRDLTFGSGLVYEDRGDRTLKGLDGRWRLLGVREPER
jgi:class 3 adenylate cyclase